MSSEFFLFDNCTTVHYAHYSNELSFSPTTVKERITKSFLFRRHLGPAKGPLTPDSEIKNFTVYVDGFMNIITLYSIICHGSG